MENIFSIVRFMTQYVCYNETTKGTEKRITMKKRRKMMNGSIRKTNYEMESNLMAENCNFSIYSMAAIAGGLLLCAGIVVYALLTM